MATEELSLEDLQKMGAKPSSSGDELTLEQLKDMGAKPVQNRISALSGPGASDPDAIELQQPKPNGHFFPTSWEDASNGVTEGFSNLGRGLKSANDFATNLMAHPIATGTKAAANPGASFREGMRAVNSNIPFANSAVEAAGGPPAESQADAKAAPAGLREFVSLASIPVGNMVGGIVGKVVETGAPIVGDALKRLKTGADDRMVGRALDDLEISTRAKTRAGVRSSVVEDALVESPALRKAVGDDAKTLEEALAMKQKAGAELDRIYSKSGTPKLEPLKGESVTPPAEPDIYRLGPNEFDEVTVAGPNGHKTVGDKTVGSPGAVLKGDIGTDPTVLSEAKTNPAPSSSKPIPVDLNKPVNNLNSRIAELDTGTSSDAAVARKLETIRDELSERLGKRDGVTAKELRAEQTDYQRKSYAKNFENNPDVSAAIKANAIASQAVGDAVVEHVTGMPYAEAKAFAATHPDSTAAKLFKANDQVSAANRIEAAIADRARKPAGIGGLRGVAKRVASHALLPAIGFGTHGIGGALVGAAASEILHAAPGVATAGLRATDRVVSATAGLAQRATEKYAISVADGLRRGLPLAQAVERAKANGDD